MSTTTTTDKATKRKSSPRSKTPAAKEKPKKRRKGRYDTEVPDILSALDEAAKGDARAAIKIIQDVIDPVQCSPLEVPLERLHEVARVWGLTTRQHDCERYTEEPVCGDPWKWEPLAADHWFEFLVVTEYTREAHNAPLHECLLAFRNAYFMMPKGPETPSAKPRRRSKRKGDVVEQRFLYGNGIEDVVGK